MGHFHPFSIALGLCWIHQSSCRDKIKLDIWYRVILWSDNHMRRYTLKQTAQLGLLWQMINTYNTVFFFWLCSFQRAVQVSEIQHLVFLRIWIAFRWGVENTMKVWSLNSSIKVYTNATPPKPQLENSQKCGATKENEYDENTSIYIYLCIYMIIYVYGPIITGS